MKLLFDANLSPKLVVRLAELFPQSVHVFGTELSRNTPDAAIWVYAREHGFAIVSADLDFVQLAEKHGHPPKVIRIENCRFRTDQIEDLLRRKAVRITDFGNSGRPTLILREG